MQGTNVALLFVVSAAYFFQGFDATLSTTTHARIVRCTNPPYVSCGKCSTTAFIAPTATPPGKLPGRRKRAADDTEANANTIATATTTKKHKGHKHNSTTVKSAAVKEALIPMAAKKNQRQDQKDIMFFDIGEVIYYASANFNYTLSGNTSVTCQADGTWTPPPKCVAYCVPLPTIANGYCSGGDPILGVSLNKRATCQCNSGYQLTGFSAVTCKLGNLWSELPKCVVPATTIGPICKTPPSIRYGSCNGPAAGTYFTSGQKTNCTCNTNYQINSTKVPTCLGNNKWAHAPTCSFYKTCPAAPQVNNSGCPTCNDNRGKIFTFQPGDTVTYNCNDGYTMSGAATITCQTSGVWSTAPVCNAISVTQCANLPAVVSGRCAVTDNVTNTNDNQLNLYNVGTQITCQCGTSVNDTNQYTMIGQANVYCNSNGQWGAAPTCNLVGTTTPPPQCSSLSITNGQCIASNDDGSSVFYVGDSVLCGCDPAYNLVGVATLNCTGQQTWSAAAPTCVPKILCGALPTINYGGCFFSSSSQYEAGQSVVCTCAQGYQTAQGAPSQNITCLNNTQWSATPVCSAIPTGPACSAPPTIKNGVCGTTGSTYATGQQVSCTCNTNYVYADSFKTAFCQGGNSWSQLPSCVYQPPQGNTLCPDPNYGYCLCINATQYSCSKPSFPQSSQASCLSTCNAPKVAPCQLGSTVATAGCVCQSWSATCANPGPQQTSESNCSAYCASYYNTLLAKGTLPDWPF